MSQNIRIFHRSSFYTENDILLTMKRSGILFFFLLVFALGCKVRGGGDDVDVRDQYIGEYDVAYTATTMIGTFPYNPGENGQGKITIQKGDIINDLKLTISFPAYNETVLARLDGARFTLQKQKENLLINNRSYEADYAGSGEFKGANLTINAISKLTTPDGTKIVKNGVFNGVKK